MIHPMMTTVRGVVSLVVVRVEIEAIRQVPLVMVVVASNTREVLIVMMMGSMAEVEHPVTVATVV